MLAINFHQPNPLSHPSLGANIAGLSLSFPGKGSVCRDKDPTSIQSFPLPVPLTRGLSQCLQTNDRAMFELQRDLLREEMPSATFSLESEEPISRFPVRQLDVAVWQSSRGICVHSPEPLVRGTPVQHLSMCYGLRLSQLSWGMHPTAIKFCV